MKRIGIIEDDEKLCHELSLFLSNNGYDARPVPAADYNVPGILAGGYHLLLLDIGLPDTDGMFLCREIRKQSQMPVIIITSRNTEITELMSMNSGADDFVAKPFHTQILLARMEAVLKRVYREEESWREENLGSCCFDLSRGIVYAHTKSAELTKNEARILACLAEKKNKIVARDELMNYLWDSELFVDDNTLTVNVTRLRGKLESIGVTNMIQTKRGQGYLLKCDI